MELKAFALLATLTVCALPSCGGRSLLESEGTPLPSLVEGTVQIPAPGPEAGPSSVYVPFTPPAAGAFDVGIRWEPQENRVAFVVSAGACSTMPCPSEIDMGSYADGAVNYPISWRGYLLPTLYTLRIDNWGPDPASCSYSVGGPE